MSSNYPYDPKQAASIGNPATPQSGGIGPGGTVPEVPLPASGAQPQPLAQNPVSGPSSTSGSAALPVSGNGSGGQRRLAPGVELSGGRYRVEQLVASGGMGAVYKAMDTRFNRPCAVKEMLDEFQSDAERSQAVEWFRREATLLLDLNHPCIPRVRDFFVEGDRHYLVMDFIEGRTLGEVLEKEGNVVGLNGARGVSEARARSWTQQLCSVLYYLHHQNPPIIFRDLKPTNIMVTARDEIKLIDFGIARTFQKSQQQVTIIMTLGYAPPEQLHGMPEPRSDIYALGATIHRLLTHHDAANNKPQIFSFPPIRSLRPDISPAFDQVIMRALAVNAEQRWPSCAEMERAILNLPPITVTPPVSAMGARVGNAQAPSGQPGSGPGSGARAGTANPLTPNTPMPHPSPTTTGPAAPYIIAAQGHLAGGRIDEAYKAVTQACGVEPNNPVVHKLFGQVFARRVPPQIELALQAYNKSLQFNPDDAETHKLVGDIWLFLRPQPAQAIPAYIKSLSLNPKDAETHFRLGQCYEKTGQIEPALREYQEALQLIPRQPVQPALHFALTL